MSTKFGTQIKLEKEINLSDYTFEKFEKIGENSVYRNMFYDLTNCKELAESKKSILDLCLEEFPNSLASVKIKRVELEKLNMTKANHVTYYYNIEKGRVWVKIVLSYKEESKKVEEIKEEEDSEDSE